MMPLAQHPADRELAPLIVQWLCEGAYCDVATRAEITPILREIVDAMPERKPRARWWRER